MKTLLLTLFTAAVVPALAAFQDPKDAPQQQDPTKPLPQHLLLHSHVGTWDCAITAHMPDGKAEKSEGTMVTRKVGELHTVDDFSGTTMGMAFTGHGSNSYCPLRKKYFATWLDSWTPGPLMLVGNYDEKTKELTLRGEGVGMSGKLEPVKTVTRWQDDDHYWFGYYGKGEDGKDHLHMEIAYTRRK